MLKKKLRENYLYPIEKKKNVRLRLCIKNTLTEVIVISKIPIQVSVQIVHVETYVSDSSSVVLEYDCLWTSLQYVLLTRPT